MRLADRAVLAGLAIAGLLGAFWFLAMAPKREQAATLQERVEQLEASVSEQEQIAAAAERARDDFDSNYQRLVVLGKAVPADEDTASLFVQLDEIAAESGVGFEAMRLEAGGDTGGATATGPEQTTTDAAGGGEGDGGGEAGSEDAAAAAAVMPTEPTVAGLPLGAAVGPAGLPVMPYAIKVNGTFFELADFLAGIDSLVAPRGDRPRVRGRLLTVDGFSLNADPEDGFPRLDVEIALTSFVTPTEQGLTAGAVPSGPAPATTTSVPAP